jgi:hypothetical protein
MKPLHSILGISLSLILNSCGNQDTHSFRGTNRAVANETESIEFGIRAGEISADLPPVIGIGTRPQSINCTGSVFQVADGKQCVLTAAHCVGVGSDIFSGRAGSLVTGWDLNIAQAKSIPQYDLAAIPIQKKIATAQALTPFSMSMLGSHDSPLRNPANQNNPPLALDIIGYGFSTLPDGKVTLHDNKKRTGKQNLSKLAQLNGVDVGRQVFSGPFIEMDRGASGQITCNGDSGSPVLLNGKVMGITSYGGSNDSKNPCGTAVSASAFSVASMPTLTSDLLKRACTPCQRDPQTERFVFPHISRFKTSADVVYKLNKRSTLSNSQTFLVRLFPANNIAKSALTLGGGVMIPDLQYEFTWSSNQPSLDISHSSINWKHGSRNFGKLVLPANSEWDLQLYGLCSDSSPAKISVLDSISFRISSAPKSPVIVNKTSSPTKSKELFVHFRSADFDSHQNTRHFEVEIDFVPEGGSVQKGTTFPIPNTARNHEQVFPYNFNHERAGRIFFWVRACSDAFQPLKQRPECSRWALAEIVLDDTPPQPQPQICSGTRILNIGPINSRSIYSVPNLGCVLTGFRLLAPSRCAPIMNRIITNPTLRTSTSSPFSSGGTLIQDYVVTNPDRLELQSLQLDFSSRGNCQVDVRLN